MNSEVTNICSNCDNSEHILNYNPVNNDIYININDLVKALPHDLRVKIYNEYFRPIKFYQMYTNITTADVYSNHTLMLSNSELFIKHLHIFVFGNIRTYIKRKDPMFETLLDKLHERGYTSVFTLIPELKPSIFLELIMSKYH